MADTRHNLQYPAIANEQKVIHVRKASDFPTPLVTGTYVLDAAIVLTSPLVLDNADVIITSSNITISESNNLVWGGTGALFRATSLSSIFLQSMIIFGDGTNDLFDVSSDLSPGLDKPIVAAIEVRHQNFSSLGTITNIPSVFLSNTQFLLYSTGLTLNNIGRLLNLNVVLAGNVVPSNSPLFTITGTTSNIVANGFIVTPLPGESVFDIAPTVPVFSASMNGSAFSSVLGGRFFKSGTTGVFTALADSATSPGVKTTVTSTAHGLSNGNEVKIKTDSVLGYDGGYVISNVTANTFDITVTFISTDTGTWDTGSQDHTSTSVSVVNNGDQPDSRTIGSYFMEDNTTITTISETGVTNLITAFADASTTGGITAFADSATSPGVKTTVTAEAHGLANGDTVIITATTNYNGTYVISNIAANTFDIIKVFTVDDATGTWTSVFTTVTSVGHGFINGQVVWITGTTSYDGRYVIENVAANTFDIVAVFVADDATGKAENGWVRIAGTTVVGANLERAKMTDNNEVTFLNRTARSGVCVVSATGETAIAAAIDAEYAVFKNDARIPNTKISRELINKRGALPITAPATFVSGDVFEIYVRNVTNTQNILVRTLQVNIE